MPSLKGSVCLHNGNPTLYESGTLQVFCMFTDNRSMFLENKKIFDEVVQSIHFEYVCRTILNTCFTMKKRTLIVCSVCLLSITSFAQESTKPAHTTPTTVLSVPALKSQAEKVHLKEQQLLQATTSSRAVYAQLKQELADLNKQYATLLSNEIAATVNENARRELEAELSYVEQQLAPAAVINQR